MYTISGAAREEPISQSETADSSKRLFDCHHARRALQHSYAIIGILFPSKTVWSLQQAQLRAIKKTYNLLTLGHPRPLLPKFLRDFSDLQVRMFPPVLVALVIYELQHCEPFRWRVNGRQP
jgi:hypothetical protein